MFGALLVYTFRTSFYRGYGLLSGKRVLYVANVEEEYLESDNEYVSAVRKHADETGGEVVKVRKIPVDRVSAKWREVASANRDLN